MTADGPVTRCRRCGVFLPPPSLYGPAALAAHPASWAQVSCPRCGLRPDGRRWVAHPPGAPAVPGRVGPPTEPLPRVAGGPPPVDGRDQYGRRPPTATGTDPAAGRHPRWGLPTVAWTGPTATPPAPPNPRSVLTAAITLLLATAVLAVLSAAAETWRFALLLQGRSAVLPAGVVATSDVLVAAAGLFTPVVTLAAVVTVVLALLRTTDWAADRAGLRPPRSRAGLVLRLLVPGWNVYGAGQVVIETHALLVAPPVAAGGVDPIDRSAAVRRRDRRLIGAWWCAWIVNVGLLVATLARGLGGSLQAIADTVELHIALDLAAAVTAALAGGVLHRMRRLTDVSPASRYRWIVQPPAPTRGRSDGPAPTGSTRGEPGGSTAPREPGTGSGPVRPAAPDDAEDNREATDPSATVSA